MQINTSIQAVNHNYTSETMDVIAAKFVFYNG